MDQASKNYLHLLWRIPAMLIILVGMPIIFIIAKTLRIPKHTELVHAFHHMVCFILGLKKQFTGTPTQLAPALYVSNHISYLDIFVLGGLRAHFIAKSEVGTWPVLGFLSRFQNTLFFERKAGRAKQQLKVMQTHLANNKRLTLFPEGTSTDGSHVVPFKSTLFDAANLDHADPLEVNQNKKRVAIQPITIAYTHYDGKKMTQSIRDNYAWYGTMPFTSHFLNIFRLKHAVVAVHFHQVCYLDEFDSRKECANYCYQQVYNQLSHCIM